MPYNSATQKSMYYSSSSYNKLSSTTYCILLIASLCILTLLSAGCFSDNLTQASNQSAFARQHYLNAKSELNSNDLNSALNNINKAITRQEGRRSGPARLHSQRVKVGSTTVGFDDPGRELCGPLPGDDDAEADHRASVTAEGRPESEEGNSSFQETSCFIISGRVDFCETRGG